MFITAKGDTEVVTYYTLQNIIRSTVFRVIEEHNAVLINLEGRQREVVFSNIV
jgi:hypothetical protein